MVGACLLMLGVWGIVARLKETSFVLPTKAERRVLSRLPELKMGMTQSEAHTVLGVTSEMPHAGSSNETTIKEGWPIGNNRLLTLVFHRESEFTDQPPARLVHIEIISQ